MVDRETDRLHALRSRPVLAAPDTLVDVRADEVARLRQRSHTAVNSAVVRALDQVHHLRAQVRALSPQKTLDRGYAVVQIIGEDQAGHTVVTSPEQVPEDTPLSIRVADGRFRATSAGQAEIAER